VNSVREVFLRRELERNCHLGSNRRAEIRGRAHAHVGGHLKRRVAEALIGRRFGFDDVVGKEPFFIRRAIQHGRPAHAS
jgi:hypothetical protein